MVLTSPCKFHRLLKFGPRRMRHREQLRSHLLRARENGVTQTELVETITHLAFYAGWPSAMTAITVAKDLFENSNVSTRRLERLEENLGAASVTLTADGLREIESGYSELTVHGARLSPEHMAFIDG